MKRKDVRTLPPKKKNEYYALLDNVVVVQTVLTGKAKKDRDLFLKNQALGIVSFELRGGLN